jgi:hypothetical protein
LPTAAITKDVLLTSQELTPQDAFILAVTGTLCHSHALALSCNWYIAFLEFKINEAWKTLLRPILTKINAAATTPGDDEISIVFDFLKAVVEELNQKELALVNIVDKMHNKELLLDAGDERSKANQLVFATLGWISVTRQSRFW